MASLMNRIVNRKKLLMETYEKDKLYSPKLARYHLADEVFFRCGVKKISDIYHAKKDKWILDYLEYKLQKIIEKYRLDYNTGDKTENAPPVWICWWDGVECAPPLVKQCIKSIQKNSGSHPVNFITKYNYKDFLEIPKFIIDKVAENKMCIANFSDYLRVSLLEKYGGLWLDATIYCADMIPEEYFSNSFFTCKSLPRESRYISKYRWTSFCLGGWKHNVFFRFFKEALEEYWKTENVSIDYLLVDYIIEVAYRNLPVVKKCMDEVEINNPHRDDLQGAMNEAISGDCWKSVIQKDTVLYKLSWRETYSEKTQNGDKSIYNYFLTMNI